MNEKFFVEIVWNREFDWSTFGKTFASLEDAAKLARDMQDSGDGARVKKARVVDTQGRVRWQYGKVVEVSSANPT